MNIRMIVCVFALLNALVQFGPVRAEDSFPGAEWERANPAESG
jgi:hypothetical protein